MKKAVTFAVLVLSLLLAVATAQNVSEVRQLACPTLTGEPLAIEATDFGPVVLTAKSIFLFGEDSCRELVSSGDSSVEGGKLVKTVISIFGPSSDVVMSELSVQGESLYFTTFGESGNWPGKVRRISLTGVNPVPTEVFGLGSTLSVDGENVQITTLFEITPTPEGALVAYLETTEGQGIYLINPETLTAKLVFADTEKQVRLNNNQLAQPRRLYVVGEYVVFFYSRDKILSVKLGTHAVSTIHSGTRILEDTTLPIYMRLSVDEGNIYLLYPIWGGSDYSFTSEIVKWDFQTNIWTPYYYLDRGKQSWASHEFDFIRGVEVSMVGLVKTATKGFDRPTNFALQDASGFWEEVATVGDQFQNFSYEFAPGNQNNGYFGAQDQSGNWGLYSVRLVPENPNQPKIEEIVNAANGKNETLAYQSIFTIWGEKLGFYQVATAVGEPPRHEATFELGGANVRFFCGDLEFPARLIFNGENQINGIVPLATQDYQTCDVQVVVNGLSSNKMSVELTDQNITLFEWSPHPNDPTKREAIFTNPSYQIIGPEGSLGVRAKRGEVITGWSTGAGITNPWLDDSQDASGVTHQWRETPIAYVGGVPVNLEYAVRAPGYNGLDQFGFRIPLGAHGPTPFWFGSDPTKIWWLYIED